MVVSWKVRDGRVYEIPTIVSNTTGDAEFSLCVKQRVCRWHFEGFDGELSWRFNVNSQ